MLQRVDIMAAINELPKAKPNLHWDDLIANQICFPERTFDYIPLDNIARCALEIMHNGLDCNVSWATTFWSTVLIHGLIR